MWAILMISLMLASVAGVIYLITRINKFSFMRKITERKPLRLVIATAIVLIPSALIWIFWGSMNAIVCILHLIVFWLISEGIFCLIKKKRKVEFRRYYAGICAVVFTVGYLAAGWYLAHNVWETDYIIKTDKKVGTFKVAMLSDSHTGTTFHGDGFAKQVERIAAQNPDVLVIVGDFVDDDTTKEDMIRCCEALGEVKIKNGIFFVFGNHDKGYYGPEYRGYSGDDLVAELKKNGVTVLQDETVLVDDRFYIIGRQDRSEDVEKGVGRASMDYLVSVLDEDKFSIVLDHQPDDYAAQADAGVDLVLSGHTHGGQLFPLMQIENIPGVGVDDQVYGYEKRGNTNFIVTSGISDWAIKFKTGCKSEYVMITVEGK